MEPSGPSSPTSPSSPTGSLASPTSSPTRPTRPTGRVPPWPPPTVKALPPNLKQTYRSRSHRCTCIHRTCECCNNPLLVVTCDCIRQYDAAVNSHQNQPFHVFLCQMILWYRNIDIIIHSCHCNYCCLVVSQFIPQRTFVH